MKRITGLAAGVMATFLVVGPGFAAESVRDSTSAEKPGKLAMPHRVTGNVVSVDESARTCTVQDSKGKDYVLTADPSLGSQLSEVKAGGHVKVSYKKNSSGQMIATKIAPADSLTARQPDLDDLIRVTQARYADAIRAYRMAQQQAATLAEVLAVAERTADDMKAAMDEAQRSLRDLLN